MKENDLEAAASSQIHAVASRWAAVQIEVAQACRNARRDPREVKIVGVTKYVDATVTAALFAAGCTCLGESRPFGTLAASDWVA